MSIAALDCIKPYGLGHWPTPLEPLDRLSEELGGPRVWVKRDDCSGLGHGGNKTRKLEYLISDALAQGADAVVTFGAVQSNHARQTAAACAKAGLDCHLLLTRQVPSDHPDYESGGNVRLDRLFGAQVHLFDLDRTEDLRAKLQAIETTSSCYRVPAGGSSAVGALGYVQCVNELVEQSQQADFALTHILHASSSAGTQSGLLYGLQALNKDTNVLGINVYHDDPHVLQMTIHNLLVEMHERFPLSRAVPSSRIRINHAYRGAGYGLPQASTWAAIEWVARTEGVLFDPVYSGKALEALIDQISVGGLREADDVVLIHTGGTPVLSVYENKDSDR